MLYCQGAIRCSSSCCFRNVWVPYNVNILGINQLRNSIFIRSAIVISQGIPLKCLRQQAWVRVSLLSYRH